MMMRDGVSVSWRITDVRNSFSEHVFGYVFLLMVNRTRLFCRIGAFVIVKASYVGFCSGMKENLGS